MAEKSQPDPENGVLKRIIMIFFDGIGVGIDDPEINPFSRTRTLLSYFSHEGRIQEGPENGFMAAADATLQIPGIPQSATGQATLFSGQNAARLLNRHLSAFPNAPLRELLRKHSLFKQLGQTGLSAAFMNAYRPLFFELTEERQWRLSATTIAALSAGLPFFHIEDIITKRALYHDFTNAPLIAMNCDIPLYTPEDAAAALAEASKPYDFSLYEFFLSDRMGHRQDMNKAEELIGRLDRFLKHLLRLLPMDETLVLAASDHGNLEDLSVKTHTMNPALILGWGRGARCFISGIHSLEDIVPAILRQAREIGKNV